jgi:exopolyphosphatase/guanosine-5'-triphosphate,3'-diphosphate pyrophosphatase
MALSRGQRLVVTRLAAILRVADALARGQAKHTREFRLERRDEELVVVVPDVTELSLEQRSMAKKGNLFEDVFGTAVRLEVG